MLLKLSSTVGTSLRVSLGCDQAEVGCWGSCGRGVQKRRPHYLNCISSSPHHMCHCSVSIHIFGQTGTYYLNNSSGSPLYKCQFALSEITVLFMHIWAEWKYLSRVPSVAPPMCQSALDCTGWFCTVKYLNCISSSPPPSPSSPLYQCAFCTGMFCTVKCLKCPRPPKLFFSSL